MAMYTLNGMKKTLYSQRWLIVLMLLSLAFIGAFAWVLNQWPMGMSLRALSISGLFLKTLLAGLGGWMVWYTHRGTKRSNEGPTAEDLDEAKHQERLRRWRVLGRWTPITSAALIVASAALLLMGVTRGGAVTAGMFGIYVAILWKLQKPFLKVEQIPDPCKRQAARARSLWRLVNQFPLFIGAVLLLHLALLSLPALFGVSLPSDLDLGFPLLFLVSTVLGSWMLGAGLAGKPASTALDGSRCDHPHDMGAELAQRPKRGVELSENLTKQTQWRRSPKLISIGAAAVILALASMFHSVQAAESRAVVSISPTRGLVALLHENDDFNEGFRIDDRIVWAELQTRMPLDVKNHDRLVEELLYRASGESAMFSLSAPGMGAFLQEELGNGPRSQEHLDRALEIVKNANITKEVGVFPIATLLKSLYATPTSALTPVQFGKLVNFTLTTLALRQSHDSLEWLGGCAWLTEQSKAGRLSPQQEQRLRPHADKGSATEQE